MNDMDEVTLEKRQAEADDMERDEREELGDEPYDDTGDITADMVLDR